MSLFSTEHENAPYLLYDVTSSYYEHSGNLQLPTAGPVGADGTLACTIVSLHAPVMVRVVSWKVKRLGVPPLLPSSTPPDSNHTLAKKIIHNPTTEVHEDGITPIHTAAGEYHYFLSTHLQESDGYKTGRNPATEIPMEGNTLMPDDFSTTILSVSSQITDEQLDTFISSL